MLAVESQPEARAGADSHDRRARGIHKPAPVSPATIDQIDIPTAAFVADPSGGQPRPSPDAVPLAVLG